jgi:hypothetical protein
LVALFTAYAVALSLLLPTVTLAAVSGAADAAAFTSLCSSSPDENRGGAPSGQGPACPCCGVMCAACTTMASSGDRPSSGVVYAPPVGSVIYSVPEALTPIQRRFIGLHAARAPPDTQPA